MAKVILERIGSPIESFMDPDVFRKNMEHMESLNRRYVDARKEIFSGWGDEYVERVHQKGKMTTWERIEMMKDPGTEALSIGIFVNHRKGLLMDKNRKILIFREV